MAIATLTDAQIARLISLYRECGKNISETARVAGLNRNTAQKYIWKWEAGKLPANLVDPPATDDEPQQADIPTESMPARILQYKRELASTRRERDELLKEREESAKLLKLFSFIQDAQITVPDWTTKQPKRAAGRAAIPTAFLSDVHLDEVVRPEQINYVNAYDRQIAEARLRLFFENTIEIANEYLHGLTYEGLVLPLGGDLFSGIIHEELIETNAATIFDSLLYWAEPLCAGIKLARDAFGRVFLPCVVGNHGRRQRKPHAKNRAQDNFDYFFYHLVKKLLSGEKGIEFAISDSADQPYTIYETRYLLTHGDQFRGGSGIAGMLSPLLIGDSRKREREQAVKRPYDYLIMGHWHQLAFLRGLIVNGSVKGYDEYAFTNNFRFEPPRQAFWVTDPRHGVTIQAPIHVQAKNEKWTAGTGGQAIKVMSGKRG